uniref:Uncharacterized protein n=1 Tax=Helianthus annuus TaxID=4232 RepID=A0A251RQB3_HELAN
MDDDGDDFSWSVRKQGLNFDPDQIILNYLFIVKVHHGGDFTDEDDFEYDGGKVIYCEQRKVP